MLKLSSSVIAGVDYDPPAKILTVYFVSGRCYDYFGVTAAVYAGLITASSAGAYFNENIRDVYVCEEVT